MKPAASAPVKRRLPGGAWWLLVVAWLCVNGPQVAFVAVVDWCVQAKNFSHQERLTADVAALLQAAREPVLVAAELSTGERELPPAPRAVTPVETVLKKLNFAAERVSLLAPVMTENEGLLASCGGCPESWRAAPPHEPPRLV